MKLDAHEMRLLSQLLDECTGLPDAERAAWLDGLSGDAARLRAHLVRLLALQSGAELDRFLAQPPQLPAAVAVEPPVGQFAVDQRIGPYRLLRAIGSGGMGEVWLATRSDGQLKRSVALKLPTLSLQRSVLVQRFERERDILGALIHPHIARLYDAGVSEDGQPYMALEFVEGIPITQAADDRAMDAAGRVRLLRQVMDAVQYAHANLVIHRDLKPGNVLVTAAGEAKLLDFGIAKLVEDEEGAAADSELTRLGGRAMTLRYAAPEQIGGGAVGTAVDIWALGVLLYELLAGSRPFVGASAQELQQQITAHDPPRPSQPRSGALSRLSRSRAGDLDTIVLKALKKSPAERYASVGAFADDLDRWLRGEPVRAQPDSRWYRMRRFVGRNRLAVTAGSLAGLALLGVTAVAVVLGLQAREESARAVAARNFMMDIFLQTDRDLSPGGREVTGRELLSNGYRSVVDRMRDQPLLQAELLLGIGDALDFMEDLLPADQALDQAAQAYGRAGRRSDAAHAALARAAMRYYNRWDTENAASLMTQAFAMHPAPLDDDAFMARYAIYRAVGAELDGDFKAEKAWYERALPYADRTFRDNSTRTVMAVRTLSRFDGKYGADQRGIERLNRLLERLMGDARARPAWIVGVLDNLGQIEFTAGRYGAALQRFDAEDAFCRRASDPRGIQCIYAQYQRALTLLWLGDAQRALETVPLLLDSSRISESSAPFATRFVLRAYQVLGANGQLERHPDLPARVRQLGDAMGDAQWQDKLSFLLVQGRMAVAQGHVRDAQALSQRALALLDRRGVDLKDFPEAWLLEGLVAQALGEHGAALASLDKAWAAQRALSGADHPLARLFSIHRARALWALGRGDEAVALIDGALPVLRDAMGEQAPSIRRIEALRADLAATSPDTPEAMRRVAVFI